MSTNWLVLRGRARLAVTALLGAAAALVWASPASAGTTTFGCTGGPQTYTVPAGIDTISVVARGAEGRGPDAESGNGGVVRASFRVRPGQELEVVVGCATDAREGGYGLHRGGDGGTATAGNPGRAGGGSSGVRLGDTILVEAGGGGGAGGSFTVGGETGAGGFGGNPPQSGSGGGGVQPGSGGVGGGAGTYHGGGGGSVTAKGSWSGGGGGGGGGHMGGAGGDSGKNGAGGGGGGGGRSYAAAQALEPAFATATEGGEGEVAVTAAVPVLLDVKPSLGPALGGQTVQVTGIDIADATSIAFGQACVFAGVCFGNAGRALDCHADVRQSDGAVVDVCTVVTPPVADGVVGGPITLVDVRVITPAGVSELAPGMFANRYMYASGDAFAPDVTVQTPVQDARYAVGSEVRAQFSCAASRRIDFVGAGAGTGPDLVTCEAVQDGVVLGEDAALDTSTGGVKRVVFRAVDALGLVTEREVTYVVDGSRPSIAVTAPSDGASYERGAELDLLYACRDQGGADDLSSCTAEVDGERVASGSRLPTGTIGGHVVEVRASDRAGNETTRRMRYFVVRREHGRGPQVAVSAPADDTAVRLGGELRARFTCRAGGNRSGQRIVDCFAQQGDEPVGQGDLLDTSEPVRKTLTVTASDEAGRVATRSVSYVVELPSPPRVEISSPSNGVVVRAGDPLRAIYSCTNPDGERDLTSCEGPVPNGAWLDTTQVGEHAFSVRAVNRAGLSSSRSVTYRVVPADTEPPRIEIASPVEGVAYLTGGYVEARYSCRDEQSAVVSCLGTVSNGGRLDTAGHGVHTLTVTARDAAGNEATRTVSYVTVYSFGPAGSAPVVELLTPFQGDAYPQGSSVTAMFSCADADGDLASCTGPVASGDAVDTTTPGAHDFTVVGTDSEGRTGSATARYSVVDAAAPEITIQNPVLAQHYPRGSLFLVDYGCIGATSCVGDQPRDTPLDTSTPGRKTFTVTATNADGTSRRTVVYYVD